VAESHPLGDMLGGADTLFCHLPCFVRIIPMQSRLADLAARMPYPGQQLKPREIERLQLGSRAEKSTQINGQPKSKFQLKTIGRSFVV
jgi:hypothetical protein